jgi:hypothetical protein
MKRKGFLRFLEKKEQQYMLLLLAGLVLQFL